MSRANVPPVNVTSTVASSPIELLIGVKLSRYAPVMVYSGFVADSVVPLGEMTSVEDLPTQDDKTDSISVSDAAVDP